MLDQELSFGSAAPPDLIAVADSAALARDWPAATLDLVYVDPPFGTGRLQRGRGGAYLDEPDDPEAHVAWLAPWLEASRAALTPTGSLFVHLDWRAVHYVKVFLDRPQRLIKRETLLELTNKSLDTFDTTINVLISRIRKKLSAAGAPDELFRTVRGGGYQLTTPVERV